MTWPDNWLLACILLDRRNATFFRDINFRQDFNSSDIASPKAFPHVANFSCSIVYKHEFQSLFMGCIFIELLSSKLFHPNIVYYLKQNCSFYCLISYGRHAYLLWSINNAKLIFFCKTENWVRFSLHGKKKTKNHGRCPSLLIQAVCVRKLCK